MVMDVSNVVGATGGTLGVVGGAAKVASSVGTGGATMGGAPRCAE